MLKLTKKQNEELKKKLESYKFQHAHNLKSPKGVEESYDCGCAWRNDVIDQIIDDLKL